MKKILSVLAALAVIGSASCFGAAAVNLSNYDVNNPIFFDKTGTLAGTGCYVVLMSGPDVIASTGGGTGVFSLSGDPGFFDGGVGNLASTVPDNSNADFTLWAWKGDGTLAGLAAAQAAGLATSASWNQKTGANTPPALPSAAVLNVPAGMIIPAVAVPEPTTLALGLIGAAGLLFFRRK